MIDNSIKTHFTKRNLIADFKILGDVNFKYQFILRNISSKKYD